MKRSKQLKRAWRNQGLYWPGMRSHSLKAWARKQAEAADTSSLPFVPDLAKAWLAAKAA